MIVFVLDLRMVRKEIENSALKEQIKKETIDFEEYSLLLEKSEQTRTFRHDIKEHLGVLNSLIDESPEKAKEYIKKICEGENEVSYSRFSDNKIFNILLSKKKGECEAGGVQLEIDPIEATLGFISDMDTVTLFSNLLNNAYESAKESGEKKTIVFGLTGTGYFDMMSYEKFHDGKMTDYIPSDEELAASLAKLPKV
jgi:sensor histidine kinase regulating citrate/malate metabolism